MVYTVYIGSKPLIITDDPDRPVPGIPDTSGFLRRKYTGQRSALFELIEQFEAGTAESGVLLFSDDVAGLWKQFKGIYKTVKAAGGIVYDPEGHVLLIYRLKHWDLPKGKIDAHESAEEAALREVEEETGLSGLKILKHYGDMYHTYREGRHRVLKHTVWFTMSSDTRELTLQTEEHIEAAVWVDLSDFLAQRPTPVYASILSLLRQLASGYKC